MSFDISGPSPSRKPTIQEAQNMMNNGGGGNLGYFQRQNKKKKDDKDEIDVFNSSLKDEQDEFAPEYAIPKDSIWEKATNWAKDIFKK